MEFRLLGPFDVVAAGSSVDLGPPKQRVLLAGLAVDAGRRVSPVTLIDRIWDGTPPREATNVLHTYMSRIRRVLRTSAGADAPATVERNAAGYRLVVDAENVDLRRFSALADRARALRPGDPQRAALLGDAVRLWRGEALAGLPGAWAARVRQRLREQRLNVVTTWAEAELDAARYPDVLEVLEELVAENPLVESLIALLMRTLTLAGRDAEALEAFARIRQRIAAELGTEPGPDLRALHAMLLRGRASGAETIQPRPDRHPAPVSRAPLSSAPVSPAPVNAAPIRPAQLPPEVHGFTGRDTELTILDSVLAAATEQPTGVPIAAIWGTAGVGKTALAVHWAHRVAHHFPDGQLYVNLRGFDAESAVDPVRAIQGFLEALDVTPARMPADVTALSALYRSVLAGRRMLVVLDNARDAGQVRPLLPGAPGCVVLVTSRDQMLGLVAAEGAQVVLLDLLPVGDARTLLARRLGAARVEAELDAVDEIIERCARLPLALAIVASRAATSPRMRLDVLADHLRRAGPGLSAMSTGDVPVDVRVAFSWSYRQLTPGAARLFRLLGLHPGPHVSTVAVMSLAGIAADEVDAFLDELVGAQLLSEDPDGRYLFHDLLRAYAAEQAHAVDTPEQHRAALTRLFDRYLADAVAATELLAPTGTQIRPPHRAADGSTPVKGMPFTDAVCAVRWLDLERPNLVAVCRYVATRGWPDYAVRIAATLWRYLNRGGHYADAVTIHTDALHAARLTGDARTEADAMNYLGTAHSRHGRYREAADLLLRAHDAFGTIGDRTGEARTLTNLGVVYGRQGRYVQAAEVLGQALVHFRELDHPHGQALVLTNLGTVHERLGHYEEAVEQHAASLCLSRTVGDRICEAHALNSLGLVYAKQGRYNEASEQLQASLTYCREMGDRVGVADALTNLGLVDMWRSRLPDALGQFQQALDLFRGAGDGYGEARVLNCLGEAMRIAGRTAAARAHHEAALAVTIGTGDQHEEARALAGLGDALVAAGDPAAARDHWRRAVGIYACLQAPEADAVRGRLAD